MPIICSGRFNNPTNSLQTRVIRLAIEPWNVYREVYGFLSITYWWSASASLLIHVTSPRLWCTWICRRGCLTSVSAISMGAPKQTLPLVQPTVQSDYFIKTKFLGEISIEKCMAFCPYRIEGRIPGADKILLARAQLNIPPEMSIEKSLVQFRLPSFWFLLCLSPLFKLLVTKPEA